MAVLNKKRDGCARLWRACLCRRANLLLSAVDGLYHDAIAVRPDLTIAKVEAGLAQAVERLAVNQMGRKVPDGRRGLQIPILPMRMKN